MMFTVSELTTALSETSPCGENLEYDPEFLAIETDIAGKPERQFGDTIVPAVEPEWADIERRTLLMLSQTYDLRVAIWLFRAACHTRGLPGAATVLEALAQWLEAHWDDVHPRIDLDGEVDATMRVNAFAPIVLSADREPGAAIGDLRAARLSASERSPTVRDLEVASGRVGSVEAEELASPSEIAATLRTMRQGAGSDLGEAIRRAIAAVRRIDAANRARLGDAQAPGFETVIAILDAALATVGTDAPAATNTDPQPQGVGPQGAVAPVVSVASGAISSRTDAARQLERAAEWIEKNEPSNPAPLLIRRALRLMDMNFLELIEELAPDGMSQVENVAGARRS